MEENRSNKLRFDAEFLFQHIHDSFRKNPAEDSHCWNFLVEATDAISDDFCQKAINEFEDAFGSEGFEASPRVEITNFEIPLDGIACDFTLIYEGRLSQNQLADIHERFDRLTDEFNGHYYNGVDCSDPEIALNADLLFQYFEKTLQITPSEVNFRWTFAVSSFQMIREPDLYEFATAIYKIVKDSGNIHSDIVGIENEGEYCGVLHYDGRLRFGQLDEIHKQLKSITAKKGMKYLGVHCEERATDVELSGSEINPLSSANKIENRAHSAVQDSIASAGSIRQAATVSPGEISDSMELDQDSFADVEILEELELLDEALETSEPLGLEEEDLDLPPAVFNEPNKTIQNPFPDLMTAAKWARKVTKKTGFWNLNEIDAYEKPMRDRHLSVLKRKGIEAADWLPLASDRFDFTGDTKIRTHESIVKRLMAINASMAWVCAPEESISKSAVRGYVKRNGLSRHHFSEQETVWLGTSRESARKFIEKAAWLTENAWSLAWMLGYKLTPTPYPDMPTPDVLMPIRTRLLAGLEKTNVEIVKTTRLRRIEEIVALEDLLYCAHNAFRQRYLDGGQKDSSAATHVGLVQERRLPLTWALSPGAKWEDTDVSS